MSNIQSPTKNQILEMLAQNGIMRLKDLMKAGISREYLRKLHRDGVIERVSRGLYRLPDAEICMQHTMVVACLRVPNGVISLLSALRFHHLTTQAPYDVWMTIHSRARQPCVTDLSLRIFQSSGAAFEKGIEEHKIEGVTIKVYSLAKTIVDCFRFRNKVGLDVALEALREALRDRRVTINELWHYATICRVTSVMRPYLEALA